METTDTVTDINETLKAMGFTLKHYGLYVASTRLPDREAYSNSLRCRAVLSINRNGKEFPLYDGDYHMGLAHISLINGAFFPDHAKAGKIISRTTSHRPLSAEDIAHLNHVVCSSRQRGPVLADVLHCIWMDGTAAISTLFEDWCEEFGVSTDSRSAYDTYNRCVQDGIRLNQTLTPEQMAKLTELFANY